MGTNESSRKLHAVCYPCPAQSHISLTLKLAKLLHHRGFHITFVNTEFNHRRLVNAAGPSFLDRLPSDFQLLQIPDGLPESDANATQDLNSLFESMRIHTKAPFMNLIADLVEKATSDTSFPPVSCIVSDSMMTFSAAPAAEKFGIPLVYLWPVPASVLLASKHFPKLMERGFHSSQDCQTDDLDTIIDWLPGLPNMRLRDFPFFDRSEIDGAILDVVSDAIKRASAATATIVHTFERLEPSALDALSTWISGPIFGVGPFSLLLNQIPEEENRLKQLGGNLWKEDRECLEWLNSREPRSVLYMNFGSIAFLTLEQLAEFAMGIANTGYPILWIIRPDLVNGDSAILPQEFVKKTKGRCLTCEWCPQEEVLYHPAIGAFLTHCGWNSTIESISAGVPMLCWPCFGDQMTNRGLVCNEWEIGLEIGKDVKRDEVERIVREIMEGDRATEMKRRAMEWRKLAEEATTSNSTSCKNLDNLVKLLLQ